MHITLTIEAHDLDEIAHFFNPGAANAKAAKPKDTVLKTDTNADAEDKGSPEAEPDTIDELPAQEKAPKKSRGGGKTAKAEKDTTTDSSISGTPTTKTDPSDEPVTFEDVRAFASGLMDSGKADGRAIQAMLKEKFNVSAFGPLKEEQYPAVMAELENLAA